MISPGIRGGLLTSAFLRKLLAGESPMAPASGRAGRGVCGWAVRCTHTLGPASGLRPIADVALFPLVELLGYDLEARRDTADDCRAVALAAGRTALSLLAVPYATALEGAWRTAVESGASSGARWCLCTNGAAIRVVDTHRTWTPHVLEFDVDAIAADEDVRFLACGLLHSTGFSGVPPVLDRLVDESTRHGVDVCRALGDGVLHALRALTSSLVRRRRADATAAREALETALTVLYRILFLLFAEARALVPVWHPVYRDRYTVDALVRALLDDRRPRGLWQALQAISRLAHAGCRAGELTVAAFNGRLFSPAHTPGAERGRVRDEVLVQALLAVGSVVERGGGRARISYADLDVEQLGSVYEQVLEYEPQPREGKVELFRSGDRRKASGTFYTPRALTDALVRRTLGPLVEGRDARDILALRVVDPAMGSGAFLVATCRYLAEALERALVRDGACHAADVTPDDRAGLRRDVALRCIFGADLNPMAVQLARLSLWLATLAAERPLTFLDHHLVCGDSLVGASPYDLHRQPPGRGRRAAGPLPLFEAAGLATTLREVVPGRVRLTLEPDETAAIVRRKERALESLQGRGSELARWRQALDLWCACWFWPGAAPERRVYAELLAALSSGSSVLGAHDTAERLARARTVAAGRRFLHWALEFPEVFFDERGEPRRDGGFDAVIGNPPWDMVRGDSGSETDRSERRMDARRMVEFARDAGIYTVRASSHVNRYQLFVERALQLVRDGGRIGLVVPSGFLSDTGAAPLRRHVFARADVDEVTVVANKAGIFPVHRSVRFALMTATAGRATECIDCRFGVDRLDGAAGAPPVAISRAFLARVSGEDDLALPDVATTADLRVLERITACVPRLGAADGWNVRFGRELNASDDRDAFRPLASGDGAIRLVEGKHIEPFRVRLDECRHEVDPRVAARIPAARRARLAYRDVASATNRLTLIAALVPPRALTTHTLFCLRTLLPRRAQLVLLALLNSYVANYLVRMRVTTHVTAAVMARLPVPFIREDQPEFDALASLAHALTWAHGNAEGRPEYSDLQALAARLYGLNTKDFERVLDTFPLVPGDVRVACLERFCATT